jgi:hypothetical protein
VSAAAFGFGLFECSLALWLLLGSAVATAQASAKTSTSVQTSHKLAEEFFATIRDGDAAKFLGYVPEGGLNVGADAHHLTRDEIEQQFRSHRGLYCKLFDSSCIGAPLNLGNSRRICSDRELLTKSERVRTAASEVTRNGVQQAVLVAEITNDQCASSSRLIDFIFNLDTDGWKLFSIP